MWLFAREEGYWVVCLPFLPLTFWMAYKVMLQEGKKKSEGKAKKE